MANRLEKLPQITGGGGGTSGSSSPEEGGGGSGTSLPPTGSQCYVDLSSKIAKLWPNHIVTHVKPDKGGDYFRVSDLMGDYVWKVTGSCQNGVIKINYTLLQQPGGVRSS